MKKNEILFSENKYTLFADRYPASKVINNYRPGFSTYKYIGLYDKDEYIVPELKTPLQGSLKSFVVSNKYYCTYS